MEAAEDRGRRFEEFHKLRKELELDPLRAALLPQLRALASGDEEKAEVERLARRPASLKAAVRGAFAYPLKGGGAALLLCGAVLAALCRALFLEPVLGVARHAMQFNVGTVVALVGGVAALIYFAAYFLDILTSTVTGSDELPEWPDVRRGGLAVDASRILNGVLVAYLPLWIGLGISVAKALSGVEPFAWIGGWGVFAATAAVALAAGSLYLPMAWLANGVSGNPLACLNPFFIVGSAWKVRGDYLLCTAACLGAAGVAALLEFGLRSLLPSRWLGVASIFVEFYGAALLLRILGLFYRLHRPRLGWD